MGVVARAVEAVLPQPIPAPAPVDVGEIVRAIRKRKRAMRVGKTNLTDVDPRTCVGCSEPLLPHPQIRGKWYCSRVSKRALVSEKPLADGVTVITRESESETALLCRCRTAVTLADECNCTPEAPQVTGIDLTLPDSVSAVRMAETIDREQVRRERVVADPSGRLTRETALRGYGAVVLCQLPCGQQRKQTRRAWGKDNPTDERIGYLKAAHKHERGAAGTYAVVIRTTAALGDLTGGRMDGETHYIRQSDAEQAYSVGVAWMKNLATVEAVRAQKANRKGSNIADPVQRVVAQALQRSIPDTDMGLAMKRALEAI